MLGSAPAQTPTPAPTTNDGAALYAANCSSCHGPLATSGKSGATSSQIQNGISRNYGGMGQLSNLTTTEIQAIATALGATPASAPTPTPSPTDGVALYASNCSSCHGQLANSDKRNATASQIQTGISNVSGMRSLSNLTTTQIQAIATALGTTPAPAPTPTPTPSPTDGATLYASNCSSCHGQLANSDKRNATASQIQTGISNVSGMRSLSNLTTTQIQAIASALGDDTDTSADTDTNACSD